MKRRKFIKIAAGGASLVALSGVLLLSKDTKTIAVESIINQLQFLRLDRPGVEAFVDDYMRDHNSMMKIKIKLAHVVPASLNHFQFWHFLAQDYLLASDFFTNQMDESKTVFYSGHVYSPYLSPCSNPFSHLHYPDAVYKFAKK